MTRLMISPEAKQDMVDIWGYIASDSVERADQFLDRLYQKAETLLAFLLMGVEREFFSLRSVIEGRYVLFYRLNGDDIELVRVLHSSRDVTDLF